MTLSKESKENDILIIKSEDKGNSCNMNGGTKKLNIKKLLIVLTALLAIAVTVLAGSYVVVGELKEQLQQNLEDVANQNAVALHNKIHSNHIAIASKKEEITPFTTKTKKVNLDSAFGHQTKDTNGYKFLKVKETNNHFVTKLKK